MNKITAEKLKELIESNEEIILINVLSPNSFEKCHIKESINIPIHDRDTFLEQAKELDKDKKIILYCANYSCPASRNAYGALQPLNIIDEDKLFVYEGGIEEWMNKAFPTEGDEC